MRLHAHITLYKNVCRAIINVRYVTRYFVTLKTPAFVYELLNPSMYTLSMTLPYLAILAIAINQQLSLLSSLLSIHKRSGTVENIHSPLSFCVERNWAMLPGLYWRKCISPTFGSDVWVPWLPSSSPRHHRSYTGSKCRLLHLNNKFTGYRFLQGRIQGGRRAPWPPSPRTLREGPGGGAHYT